MNDSHRDDPFRSFDRHQEKAQAERMAFSFDEPNASFQPQQDWEVIGPHLSESDIEQSQRQFMRRIYDWMFLGLALTGFTAWIVARTPAILQVVMPLLLPLAIAELILAIGLIFFIRKMSPAVAGIAFVGYSVLTGVSFSTLFLAFQMGSIARVFLLCGAMFGAMSLYGTFTKKNLSAWRSFLVMGLFGVIGALLLNLIFRSALIDFVTACVGVIVFSGLTAYDTQKLRALHMQALSNSDARTGEITLRKLSIIGALQLYLDFINLFLSLLRLFGRRN